MSSLLLNWACIPSANFTRPSFSSKPPTALSCLSVQSFGSRLMALDSIRQCGTAFSPSASSPPPARSRAGRCDSTIGSGDGDEDGSQADRASSQLRRRLVVGVMAWIMLLGLRTGGSGGLAALAEEDNSGSTTTAKTGLVQKLLERSKANKAKNDQERLDDYYRRNFKDYFDFIKGSFRDKDKDKLTEVERGILEWLEKNK